MIAFAWSALLGAPTLSGLWLWLHLHLADRRTWVEETDTWHGPAIADLPVPREELTAPDLPRRSPVLHPTHDEQQDPPTLDVLERVAAGLRGLASERVSNEYEGRHRIGVATGSSAQAARLAALREPTAEHREFDGIISRSWDTGQVAALRAEWVCGSCGPGRDGEPRHVSCSGCLCPCGEQTVPMIGRPPADLVAS